MGTPAQDWVKVDTFLAKADEVIAETRRQTLEANDLLPTASRVDIESVKQT